MSSPSSAERRAGRGATAAPGRAARLDRLDRAPDGRRPGGPARRLPGGRPGDGLQRRAARRAGRATPTRRRRAGRRGRAAGLDLPAGTERVGGADALETLATRDDVDLVIVATGGVVSLRPVLAALRAGKVVATANKETLVAGGHLVMPLAARPRARPSRRTTPGDPYASPLAWLRPIDSEHSAIWQCLVGEDDGRRRERSS